MRRCFLVCYDIRDPKRLRRVHKICKGYGESWQFSIFFCVIKAIDRVRLQTELEGVMNLKEDQILIIDLGTDETTARSQSVAIGQPMEEMRVGMVVV
jgi:CRISPR-associated protein Cas2